MPGAARLHDVGSCPIPPHPPTILVDTSPDVYINGRNAERVTSVWSCGAHQSEGSPDVFINGHPQARLGDHHDHGGQVITSSDNVLVNEIGVSVFP